MNSTFNKMFYTFLTESLFLDLRYKYISKEAVELGSFSSMFSTYISRT